MEGLIFIHEHLHGSDFFNQFVRVITALGDVGFVWIALAVMFLFFRKTRRAGLVMLVSLAIGYVFNDFVLKNIIARPRPFAVNSEFAEFIKSIGMKFPSGFSMPSGHAYSSFNCALILTLFFKKKGAYSFIVATLIALSRIFLCVHYPTDVLLGAALGLLTALLVFITYRSIIKRYKFSQRLKIHDKSSVSQS